MPGVTSCPAWTITEKKLQNLIEANMDTFFGVKFLASEYSTGRRHRGRIDSIGIDENGSPVIFEYKRSRNENVVNQGLFYLDWLLDHKAEFELLVMKTFPQHKPDVDWINPRLLCIAGDFNQYDQYAVEQIQPKHRVNSIPRLQRRAHSVRTLDGHHQSDSRI